jgi:branched-chain amino acid transport system permease protein
MPAHWLMTHGWQVIARSATRLLTSVSARTRVAGAIALAVLMPSVSIVINSAVAALAIAYVLASAIAYRVGRNWPWAVQGPLIVLALILPYYFTAYDMTQLLLLGLVAIGMNLITGFAGQTSMAQGVFVGVGAYSTAILMVHYGWNFWATIPVSVLASALVALLIAIPSARLAGIYQVMTTLALAVSFPILAQYFKGLTGGSGGISVPTAVPPHWLTSIHALTSERYGYFIVLLFSLVAILVVGRIVRGHPGRAMRAMRDNEVSARMAGINLAQIKVTAFVVSGACAGLGGCAYAATIGVVAPDAFPIFYSIQFLVIIVVGGLGSISGSFLGAAIIWELGLKAGQVTLPFDHYVVSAEVVYGVVLIVILIFMPHGVMGLLQRLAGNPLDGPTARRWEPLRRRIGSMGAKRSRDAVFR